MRQRYWIEFDDDGEIVGIYKSKSDAEYISGKECEEFIVKLIPIKRVDKMMEEITDSANDFVKNVKKVNNSAKKFQTEFQKMSRDVRRFKI